MRFGKRALQQRAARSLATQIHALLNVPVQFVLYAQLCVHTALPPADSVFQTLLDEFRGEASRSGKA